MSPLLPNPSTIGSDLRDLMLPEFDKHRHICGQKCLVFDNDNVEYDIILGTNFLTAAEIKLN